jgi:hypothetical protein
MGGKFLLVHNKVKLLPPVNYQTLQQNLYLFNSNSWINDTVENICQDIDEDKKTG